VNRLGFRDQERLLQKPPGVFRIMALGDSMTEADQVNPDQTYCARLEKRLSSENRPVEVLNCGVNGYSPLQELLVLRREGPRFQPDLVIVGIFLDNDVAGCHPRLNTTAGQSPSASLNGDELQFDFSQAEESFQHYHREPVYSIRKYSAIYRWLRTASDRRVAAATPSAGVPTRHKLYAYPVAPDWEEAWAVFEQSLMEMSAEAKRQGAQFVIVSLPCAQAVVPESWKSLQHQFPQMDDESWDVERPERRLQEFAARHGLELLQLLPVLRKQVDGEPLFFGDVGHMTAHGHDTTAEGIAEYLSKQELKSLVDLRAASSSESSTAKEN
jgi:hypothetical protein